MASYNIINGLIFIVSVCGKRKDCIIMDATDVLAHPRYVGVNLFQGLEEVAAWFGQRGHEIVVERIKECKWVIDGRNTLLIEEAYRTYLHHKQ